MDNISLRISGPSNKLKIQRLRKKKIDRKIYLFFAGFIIYSTAYAISITARVNYILCDVARIIGLILIIPSVISLVRFQIENRYLKLIYLIFCFWSLIVIYRGFFIDYLFFKKMLFDVQFGIFVYFIPLILLFPKTATFYKKLFSGIAIMSIIFLIFNLLFLEILRSTDGGDRTSQYVAEALIKGLALPSGLIMMTFMYHSNKRNILAIFTMLVAILISFIRARRALIFMSANLFIFSYLLYALNNKKNLVILVLSFLCVFLTGILSYKLYTKNKSGIFNLVTERGYEDTRTRVEDDFFKDMKKIDWIIGRGINGTYYSPDIEDNLSPGSDYRGMIETDYLNIILKGGIISLLLLLLITIPAVIKGLFFSKNFFSIAAALWILWWLLSLYPNTVTTFSLNYLLVWISIGICYTPVILKMTDEDIKKYIFS